MIKTKLPKDRRFFIELKLSNRKWLLFPGYNPKNEFIMNFLQVIGNHLDSHMEEYDNLILIGDYNSEMEKEKIKDFCEIYNIKNLKGTNILQK